MPKGYMLFEIEITEPVEYEVYRSQTAATLLKYGGKYLVRGGDPKIIEGTGSPARVVITEFDSVEQALDWYNSPEYQAILPVRLRTSRGRSLCLTGA